MIGGCFLVKALLSLDQISLNLRELISLAGIAAATLIICKLMRIKKRLSAYACQAHQPI